MCWACLFRESGRTSMFDGLTMLDLWAVDAFWWLYNRWSNMQLSNWHLTAIDVFCTLIWLRLKLERMCLVVTIVPLALFLVFLVYVSTDSRVRFWKPKAVQISSLLLAEGASELRIKRTLGSKSYKNPSPKKVFYPFLSYDSMILYDWHSWVLIDTGWYVWHDFILGLPQDLGRVVA